MKKEEFLSQMDEYFSGNISEERKARIEQALASDPELKRHYSAYETARRIEASLAASNFEAPPHMATRLMGEIENQQQSYVRRMYMNIAEGFWAYKRSIGIVAVAGVACFMALQVPQEMYEKGRFSNVSQPVENKRSRDLDAKERKEGPVVPEPVAPRGEEIKDLRDKLEGQPQSKAVSPIESITQPEESTSQVFKKTIEGRDEGRVAAREMAETTNVAPAPKSSRYDQATLQAGSGAMVVNDALLGLEQRQRFSQQPSTEQYNNYAENERLSPRDQALSTFSIDVDTASYTNVRRYLKSGTMPPVDAVRIEEFLNYFDYDYPIQHEKPFTLSYEMAPAPLESGKVLLKLGIKARDAQPSESGWNLVFLVDVSGSMNEPDKLPLVRSALKTLVETMKPSDRIAIVTYAGNAGLVLDSTPVSEKSRILSAIDTLTPGGSTHGSAGIKLAYDVALQAKKGDGVNRVVLATDGDFNVGTTSQDELIKLIEEKRRSGITLTTLGFGTGNLKDGMMEQLANKGNGNYFYIDSFSEARKVFQTQLAGTMEVVAKDVKLQVEFNPAVVASYRLVGYDNRRLRNEDFHNDRIDAGEIGSGHTVTALYELVLSDSPLASQVDTSLRYQKLTTPPVPVKETSHLGEVGFLKIRFKAPNADTSELLNFTLEKEHLKSDWQTSSDDFRFAAAVSYFAGILKHSEFVGDYTLTQVADLAQAAKGKDSFGYRQEFVELVKNARAISGSLQ